MQKLLAAAGATVVASSIAFLALIVGAVTLAAVCSTAADQLPHADPPSLPTRDAGIVAATATPSPASGENDQPPLELALATTPAVEVGTANFTGSWLVREYIIEGEGARRLTTYEISLVQEGVTLTGSGGGMSLRGRVDGKTADLEYRRPADGSSGVLTWTLHADGAAAGVLTATGSTKGLVALQKLP
jgi:hypothetical protein